MTFLKAILLAVSVLFLLSGCSGDPSRPEKVWGRKGVQAGDFVRPRAIAIDGQDRLFIVDFTARIQVFDTEGSYLNLGWTMPDYRDGRPSGLSIGRDGNLLVSDSHYHCVRIYSPEGKELGQLGGDSGSGPGQLGYVSDVVQDSDGFFYVAEFGENQRISKFEENGRFVCSWGRQGSEPGEFNRVRALAIGPDGLIYVADAGNHRIQVFQRDGRFVRAWGEVGTGPGQLSYPYDLAFSRNGELYVVEYGNSRVQKFADTGKSLGCWGGPGREPGRLHNPWALAVDSHGRVHVLDTENHRVQRIAF